MSESERGILVSGSTGGAITLVPMKTQKGSAPMFHGQRRSHRTEKSAYNTTSMCQRKSVDKLLQTFRSRGAQKSRTESLRRKPTVYNPRIECVPLPWSDIIIPKGENRMREERDVVLCGRFHPRFVRDRNAARVCVLRCMVRGICPE